MTRADLLALADRVEREEPSKELHHAVLHACGWSWRRTGRWINDATGEQRDGVYGIDPLHSIDAAASLCRADWEVIAVGQCNDGWRAQIWICPNRICHGTAPTEPRARTAAALRARAQEMSDE